MPPAPCVPEPLSCDRAAFESLGGGIPAIEAEAERAADALRAFDWTRDEMVRAGARAWEAVVHADARVSDTREPGQRLFVDPRMVGRRYAELVDPFALLLHLERQDVELAAISPESVLLEILRP